MRGAIFIFSFFALCLLLFFALLAGRHYEYYRQPLLFISSVVCVPLNVPIDFNGHF